MDKTRRAFLTSALAISAGGFASLDTPAAEKTPKSAGTNPHAGSDEGDVTPTEDLMREHGVLNRILLIYDDAANRLSGNQHFPREVIVKAAGHIREFIENYHEKSEEGDIFPRLEKAGKLTDLVATLRQQHAAGRKVTANILAMTESDKVMGENRQKLGAALNAFVRMYRPHEAREDTVVFPTFRKIVSEREMDEIGEKFEDLEHKLFGKEGFEGVVAQVADLEKQIGIYDLNQFTPS
ncbi:MAG TPA: hemerythrin domain-containing protein [Candidatus Obscuribacterales bacterium]